MFDIFYNSEEVGTAQITKEGLYYKIKCTCTPPDSDIYRIILSDGVVTKDLGICVPYGDHFGLIARIPVKEISAEAAEFRLVSKENAAKGIAVASNQPCDVLDRLENARLQITDGQPMLVIYPVQDPLDSDPNP